MRPVKHRLVSYIENANKECRSGNYDNETKRLFSYLDTCLKDEPVMTTTEFRPCSEVHPDGLRVCEDYHGTKHPENCAKFRYEDDVQVKRLVPYICKYCLVNAGLGVCELAPYKSAKEVKP